MKKILNGIIYENPILVSTLGLCSALAVTNKFENAYVMGICVLMVVTLSNLIISIIKKLVPENVKIPVYILIIATLVTIIEILLQKYVKPLYDILGIYLPLIVVNCIILGRALQVASKEKVIPSVLDGIGVGLGYTLALMIIGLIREILGSNTITLMDNISTLTGYKAIYKIFPTNDFLPINIFSKEAGAFLTLGLLIALAKYIGGKHESN
jgi:electron transport complex protein RnfE